MTLGRLIASLLVLAAASVARGQCTQEWIQGGGLAGVDGRVDSSLVRVESGRETLYVGGEFTRAGEGPASSIAKWNGRWRPLGTGVSIGDSHGVVRALTEWNGLLIAGGRFDGAGGQAAVNIASWSEGQWSPIGAGIGSEVRALAVFEGVLYAAAHDNNAASNGPGLLRWTGATWEDIAPAGTLDGDGITAATALVVHDGSLFAAYRASDELAHQRIARWDGQTWTALESWPDLDVGQLAVHGGELYAGGANMSPSTFLPARHWTGEAWVTFGGPLLHVTQVAPTLCLYSWANRLWVSGDFLLFGEHPVSLFAYQVGQNLAVHTLDMEGSIHTMCEYDGALFTGGTIRDYIGVRFASVATYQGPSSGQDWRPIGTGIHGPVFDIFMHNGDLVGTGFVQSAGGRRANRVVRWDGRVWQPFTTNMRGSVLAAASFEGYLYAGGSLSTSHGLPHVAARWTGSDWTELGVGFLAGQARAITVHNSKLYIGGSIPSLGDGTLTQNLAVWDGWTLAPIPNDPPEITPFGIVQDLCEFEGQLVAGRSSSFAHAVARHDGERWHPMGSETVRGTVRALVVHDGFLYAGGQYLQVGNTGYGNLMRWDGSAWSAPDPGLGDDAVTAMASTPQGLLVASGGYLPEYSGTIKMLSGTQWRQIAVTSGEINDIHCEDWGMFVAGDFEEVNGVVSHAIAEWRIPVDLNRNAAADALDITSFLTEWFAKDWRADWDDDDVFSPEDIIAFLTDWFAACP